MGAWRRLGKAAAFAATLCCATRAGASTVVEPIARLYLEGAYDSNALYLGSSDSIGQVSPVLGVRLRAPLWEMDASYGGDLIYYRRLQPGGTWNHRGNFSLKAHPTERTTVDAGFRGIWAFDPVGLAEIDMFRTGMRSALVMNAKGRVDWRADRRWDLVAAIDEEMLRFDDKTGGAMHAPSLEALWRVTPRWIVGGGYALKVFQTFDATGNPVSTSQSLRGRVRYQITRRFNLNVFAGPALWLGGGPTGTNAIIPEAGAELLGTSPNWDLRFTVSHGFGIGYLARPSLVNFFEFGGERRFQRRYFLRASGGIWESGEAPSGSGAITGYGGTAESGMVVGGNVRISLTATQFGRMNDPSPAFRRTIVGLRLGWELPVR